MPGAEVYTISGAGFAAAEVTPAAQLQNALKALGNTNGDPQLSRLAVDGVIGPGTVKAVNYALSTYVGGTADFPRADLTVLKVRQYAGRLATIVTQRVQKSGGTVPEAHVVHASSTSLVRQTAASTMDETGVPRWVWYVVGGVSVLIVLSLATAAVKKAKTK